MMQHKKWIYPMLIVVVMFLSGCTVRTTEDNVTRSNEPQIVPETPKTFVYESKNDFSFVARVEQDIVWLFLPYKTLILTREPSASGEKFSDSRTLFGVKGHAAVLEYNDITYRKGETTYRTTAHGKNLTVMIEAWPCTDSMSGDAFETTVWVRLDQNQYQGCVRALH